jgi:hypothetical protein
MSLWTTDHVWSLGELIRSALSTIPPDVAQHHKKPNLTIIEGGKE